MEEHQKRGTLERSSKGPRAKVEEQFSSYRTGRTGSGFYEQPKKELVD